MRVIEPRMLPRPSRPHHARHRITRWIAWSGLILFVAYGALFVFRYTRPLPILVPEAKNILIEPQLKALNLPLYGQVAAGAVGYGQLAKSGDDTPRPMASVAKVVTALVILDKKPLKPGEQGPTLTLDAEDVALYEDYLSRGGSVARVQAGEQISEYQALQALLLPSANNMADSLARWAYGSVDGFIEAANTYLASQGLKQTTLADASGFSPKTVSTASNLVKLGELALKNPAVSEIAAQSTATIPVAGEISNVNTLLGKDGIDGIKTGNTDEAGGCFLTTVQYKHASGNTVRMIVAVMGAATLQQAMQDARQILSNLSADFSTVSLPAGTVVGYYNVPWGERVSVVTKQTVSLFRWQGTAARGESSLPASRFTNLADQLGELRLSAGPNQAASGLQLDRAVAGPSWSWRARQAVAL